MFNKYYIIYIVYQDKLGLLNEIENENDVTKKSDPEVTKKSDDSMVN